MKRERRKTPRVSMLSKMHRSVEIRASRNQSVSASLLNLSRHGALLELDRHQSSHIRVDERVSVKLHLPQDVVWLAGIVRHRYASKLGVYFPSGVGAVLDDADLMFRKTVQPLKHHRPPQAMLHSL